MRKTEEKRRMRRKKNIETKRRQENKGFQVPMGVLLVAVWMRTAVN
jgi:hypothetical protein